MTEHVDVVVVGAGAMGATSAWRLARAGRRVTVLERFGPGHTRGSSHGATRIFRLAYRDPRYVALAERALGGWRELEAASGDTLLEQVGQIDHGRPEAVADVVSALRSAGRPVEELGPQEAAERWPGMRFDRSVAHSPEGGRCWAERTVAAAQRLAAGAGAEVRFDERVERIEVSGSAAVVHTAAGSWRAPVVVVAAGAWVGDLLAGPGGPPGFDGLAQLVVESDQPSHFSPRDPGLIWPSFLHHGDPVDGVDRPLHFDAYGLFAPGEGVKVGGFGTVVPADPDDELRVPDPARTATLVDYVERWLPGLDPLPTSTTSCLFTTTADEHFVLDRIGPVVVCSPCSGHGFKFVPAIAEIVEQLATGGGRAATHWRTPRSRGR